MCDCTLPIYRVNLPFNSGAVCPSDRRIYGTVGRRDPLNDCQISPADLPLLHLGGENCGAVRIFRQNKSTCGIPVQAVDAAVDEGLSLFLKIPGGSVGKGVIVVADGRVDRHVRRLIYNQKIFILIENGKIHFHRQNILTVFRFRDMNAKKIPGMKNRFAEASFPV